MPYASRVHSKEGNTQMTNDLKQEFVDEIVDVLIKYRELGLGADFMEQKLSRFSNWLLFSEKLADEAQKK